MTTLQILFSLPMLTPSPNPASADLDGDHVPDRIRLECTRGEDCSTGTYALQASRSESTVVAVPGVGEAVIIEASDDVAWCLVRTSEGVWGSFRLTRYGTVVRLGLRGLEVFQGLSHAD